MGKGALRPFFKGHSLKKEKEHEKKEVDKMLSHFVTLPFFMCCTGAGKRIIYLIRLPGIWPCQPGNRPDSLRYRLYRSVLQRTDR